MKLVDAVLISATIGYLVPHNAFGLICSVFIGGFLGWLDVSSDDY